MCSKFSDTYAFKMTKFSLNISKCLRHRIKVAAFKEGYYHSSTYVRHILEKHHPVEHSVPPNLEKSPDGSIKEIPPDRVFLPKKYHGFVGGLMRNSYFLQKFTKKSLDMKEKV